MKGFYQVTQIIKDQLLADVNVNAVTFGDITRIDLSKQTMFPVGWKDKRLKAKDWVYGVLLDSIPRAYPLKKLKGTPVLNDAVGSRNLVIVSEAKQHTVRVYERREQFFSESDDESALLDADGNNWEIYEDHLFQPDQELTLKRLPGHLSFWFAWFAFFQNTEIWEKTKIF